MQYVPSMTNAVILQWVTQCTCNVKYNGNTVTFLWNDCARQLKLHMCRAVTRHSKHALAHERKGTLTITRGWMRQPHHPCVGGSATLSQLAPDQDVYWFQANVYVLYWILVGKCHDTTWHFNYYLEANVAICHDLTLANFIFFLVLSHTSALGDRVARARLSLYCLPKISIICVTHIQIYLKFFSFLAQFSQKKVVKLSRQFCCGATCLHVSQKKRSSRQMSRYATYLFIYFR